MDRIDLADAVDTIATDLFRSRHDLEAPDDMDTYDFEHCPGV